jgi:GH25 family lysozyme M1 (1,4-beta-N-acetylmuramidase)
MNPGDRGLDCSKFQHPGGAAIDYQAVKDSGITFAIIELNYGTNTANPYCVQDARGFQAVGIETGAYHFYLPGGDSVDDENEQTSDFSKLYLAIGGWTLGAWLDVETESDGGWAVLAKLIGDQRTNLIGALGTRQVGFYMDQNFYDHLPGAPWGDPLWLADPSHPESPSKPCLLQQLGTGEVPGIVGPVDLDIWRGGVTPPPAPPPPPIAEKRRKMPFVAAVAGTAEQFVVWDDGHTTGIPNPGDSAALCTAFGQPNPVTFPDGTFISALPTS